MKTIRDGLILAALAGAALACSGGDKTKSLLPGVTTGTLVQRWSIEGSKDVRECGKFNADRMRLVVFDSDGDVHATQFAPCTAFEANLTLETKTYTAAATLLDRDARPVSNPQAIGAFSITHNKQTVQEVDIAKEAFRPAQ
jgi:hypothetical protein